MPDLKRRITAGGAVRAPARRMPALFLSVLAVMLAGMTQPRTLVAQTTEASVDATQQDGLLTPEELQNLVAPIALFPDTVLIQIAVASTVPLDVMKAERFLLDNAEREPAELEPEIDAMGWDPSVSVLALAFPDVIGEMATHIDWTETLGTAMLAQSEDVLDAVQVMRQSAINSGALISGPEQTVELVEDNVVIAPTDPEVVYVPQYQPQQVYGGTSTGDILGATLLTFGTVAVIDAIFDDDDDWNDYWGCRNCGGWGGGPIIRDPDIDIDIDGNVNIGNRLERGDTDIAWKPQPDRADAARDKLADRNRGEALPGKLPVDRKPGRTNNLRQELTDRGGVRDISRDGAAAAAIGGGAGAGLAARNGIADRDRPGIGADRNAGTKAAAVRQTKASPPKKLPAVKAKPAAKKTPKAAAKASPAKKPKAKGTAMKKKSAGPRTAKASSRGKAAKGKGKGKGRK